jgi:hypothetical protein
MVIAAALIRGMCRHLVDLHERGKSARRIAGEASTRLAYGQKYLLENSFLHSRAGGAEIGSRIGTEVSNHSVWKRAAAREVRPRLRHCNDAR